MDAGGRLDGRLSGDVGITDVGMQVGIQCQDASEEKDDDRVAKPDWTCKLRRMEYSVAVSKGEEDAMKNAVDLIE